VRIEKNGTDWSVVVSLILAAIGFVGIVVAICTAVIIRRQTKATEDAVEAANKSYTLAEDTTKRQLRAYMNYRQGKIFVVDGKVPRIAIELENTGQTPAYSVQGNCASSFGRRPAPVVEGADATRSIAVIGARKSFTFDIPMTGWDSDTIAALSGGALFYIAGKFTYLDIFREKTRNISFQIVIGASRGPMHLEEEEGKWFYRFLTDSEGNEAD
jgi:hypothetical protein